MWRVRLHCISMVLFALITGLGDASSPAHIIYVFLLLKMQKKLCITSILLLHGGSFYTESVWFSLLFSPVRGTFRPPTYVFLLLKIQKTLDTFHTSVWLLYTYGKLNFVPVRLVLLSFFNSTFERRFTSAVLRSAAKIFDV